MMLPTSTLVVAALALSVSAAGYRAERALEPQALYARHAELAKRGGAYDLEDVYPARMVRRRRVAAEERSTSSSKSCSTTKDSPSKAVDIPTTNGTSTGSAKGDKKGLAWGAEAGFIKNFAKGKGVKFFYNWGPSCPQEATDAGLSCVSMLWGDKGISTFQKDAAKVDFVMGMNEVNLASQSDISVSRGIEMWNQYIRPLGKSKYLVSPSVTSAPSGFTWLQDFFKGCKGADDNCGVDAISLHYYGKDAQGLIDYCQKFYDEFKLPIWMSEYACQDFTGKGDCSSSQIKAFLQGVADWAEKTEWVAMHSPFGMMTDTGNVAPGNALMDKSGKPTSLGQWWLDN